MNYPFRICFLPSIIDYILRLTCKLWGLCKKFSQSKPTSNTLIYFFLQSLSLVYEIYK